jgi:hypothetical protein
MGSSAPASLSAIDADDLEQLGLAPALSVARSNEPPANRTALTEIPARECLVDDDRLRRSRVEIVVVQIAAERERNAHRLEKPRTDQAHVNGDWGSVAGVGRLDLLADRRANRRPPTDRLHARQRPNRGADRRHARRLGRGGKSHVDPDDVRHVETRIGELEPQQISQQDGGSCQQDEANRDLRRDERALKSDTAEQPASSARLQPGPNRHPAGGYGWRDTTGDRHRADQQQAVAERH